MPGKVWTGFTPHDSDIARGNVVITVQDADDVDAAQALARAVAGPDSPALRAAGQAVIVDDPRGSLGVSEPEIECDDDLGKPTACPTVVAYARDRAFATHDVGDPALRAFAEYWLGRAAG